jgi:hypothetical protein
MSAHTDVPTNNPPTTLGCFMSAQTYLPTHWQSSNNLGCFMSAQIYLPTSNLPTTLTTNRKNINLNIHPDLGFQQEEVF